MKPSYYDAGGVSVLDVLKAKLSKEELQGFYKGNVLKYVMRAGLKDPNATVKDLEKAQQYLTWLIETYAEGNHEA